VQEGTHRSYFASSRSPVGYPIVCAIACLISGCGPSAMFMPPIERVGTISCPHSECELTASVPAGRRLGEPIDLAISIRNRTNRPSLFLTGTGDDDFEIWVLDGNRQMPLTPAGRLAEPRKLEHQVFWDGGSSYDLSPGESRTFPIRLSDLFKLDHPGVYTVIVESRPVDDRESLENRIASSVKTSFTLLRTP
jgi:hypothetical protein